LKRLLSVLILCLWVPMAGASQRIDLYSAEALVPDQSAVERNRAVANGLGEIVLRVSGDRSALENPAIRRAMGQSQTYLYEFSYASTPEQLERDGRMIPARRLVLKFSPQAIEELLRSANLPLWPANRPSLLVWLVVSEPSGSSLVTGAAERDALRAEARRRGLPLITPLMDLEDRLALSGRDLWAMDEEVIRTASRRYGADAILVGRYSQTSGGQWRSGWQLFHAMGNQVFDSQHADLETVLASAVNEVADHFASLYAIVPRDEGPDAIVMQVSGINDFAAFKQVQRYLDGLPMVRRTEVLAARQDALLLRLYAEGSMDRLLTTLGQDRYLAEPRQAGAVSLPENRYLPQGTLANPLIYNWRN
jgi:uncharacterized protein